MNWDALGAVAEMLAAVGVIVSLLYLASQVRENTDSIRFSRYDSFIHAIADARKMIIENEEVASIWERGLREPSELNSVETARLRAMLYSGTHAMETLHLQLIQSGLDTGIWERQAAVITRIMGSPGGMKWWEEHSSEFDQEFVEAINTGLDRST
jgi:hypothetical protein